MSLLFRTSLAFIVSLSLLYSCKSDKYEEPSVQTHRLKEIVIYQNDYPLLKSELHYNGELIIHINDYAFDGISWKEESHTDISYLGNEVSIIHQYLINDAWQKGYRYDLKIENDKLIERTVFSSVDNIWMETGKHDYHYKDDKFIDDVYSRFKDGNYTKEWKTMCFYNENQLHEIREYELEQQILWMCCRVFTCNYSTFNQTQISEQVKRADNLWETTSNYVLVFDNGHLEQYRTPDGTFNYIYDANGLLSQTSEGNGYKTVFIYENGNGNAQLLYNNPIMTVIGLPEVECIRNRNKAN